MKKVFSVLFALVLAVLLGFTPVAAVQAAAENVELVGSWPFGPSYAVAYDSDRNIAFGGSGGGVFVLDMSDPISPEKLSEIRTQGVVHGLFYQPITQFLFLAAGVVGLEIWHIEDPANPTRLGCY